MDKWIGVGRTTKDIETNQTGKIGWTSLAVDRRLKDQNGNKVTDFISIRFLGEKAVQRVKQYVPKGTKIIVTDGELWVDNYTDKNGNRQSTTYIVVHEWEFAESKKASNSTVAESAPISPMPDAALPSAAIPDGFVNVPQGEDDFLPFS